MRVRIPETRETGIVIGPEVNGKVLIQLDGSGLLRIVGSGGVVPVAAAARPGPVQPRADADPDQTGAT